MIIVDFTNIKGGVAKTTTTLDVGYALGRMGRKVLIVDLDPQANVTYSATGVLSNKPTGTLYEVLVSLDPKPLQNIIVETKQQNVLIAPGSISLSSADIELAGRPGREWILQEVIEEFATFCKQHNQTIDYILFDTPPNLGLLSVNALVAAGNRGDYHTGKSGFIVPVSADVYATIGISHLKGTVNTLSKSLRISIQLLGAVATMTDETKESKACLGDIQAEFGTAMFKTTIPRNVKVKEANNQRNLYDHAPTSTGAQAYWKLTEEVIARAEAR
jgi:chromosome partitioning protein